MPTYTEKEVAELQRTAFMRGSFYSVGVAPVEAFALYPTPTITRPRVVKLDGPHDNADYRIVDGQMQYRYGGFKWRPWYGVAAVLDLINNPTETVEA